MMSCIRRTMPGFLSRDHIDDLGNGLFRVCRRVTNQSGRTRRVKLVAQLETRFKPQDYLMPCILYNGNQWGSGNSPKGLTYDGKPWIFAYDRMGILSCTLTENRDVGLALFASDQDKESLRTSASLVRQEDGTFLHRIYYPVTEAPVTYSGKNKMTQRYDEYYTLTPGENLSASPSISLPAYPNGNILPPQICWTECLKYFPIARALASLPKECGNWE